MCYPSIYLHFALITIPEIPSSCLLLWWYIHPLFRLMIHKTLSTNCSVFRLSTKIMFDGYTLSLSDIAAMKGASNKYQKQSFGKEVQVF